MYNKLKELNPGSEKPFEGDLCQRADTSFILKNLIEAFDRGCVIGVNGRWGSGKTTFLRMFEKYMGRFGYQVVSFNAWMDDYMNDPMIGIVSEFYNITCNTVSEKTKTSLLDKLKSFLYTSPYILSQLIEHKTGINPGEIITKVSQESLTDVQKTLTDYADKKQIIENFRNALKDYVIECCREKPLIYIIDELDRCNPTYAVKTLERIKHLFNIENIVFIIATDHEQLCNSIKGYFGSESFDADNYLKRFFDIQLDLPKATSNKLIHAALERFGYLQFCNNRKYEFDEIEFFIDILYSHFNLSIRELEKFLLYLKLVLIKNNFSKVSIYTIILLAYIKTFHNECYKKFISQLDMSDDEFINYIETHFTDHFFEIPLGDSEKDHFYTAIAELMISRYTKEGYQEFLMDDNGNLKFKFNKFEEEALTEAFKDSLEVSVQITQLSALVDIADSYNFNL